MRPVIIFSPLRWPSSSRLGGSPQLIPTYSHQVPRRSKKTTPCCLVAALLGFPVGLPFGPVCWPSSAPLQTLQRSRAQWLCTRGRGIQPTSAVRCWPTRGPQWSGSETASSCPPPTPPTSRSTPPPPPATWRFASMLSHSFSWVLF